MWILYSFTTAAFETAKDVVGKKASTKSNEYVTAFSLQLFAWLALLPFVLYSGIPELKFSYYLSLIAVAIFIPLWSILYMKAVKVSPLSLVVPVLALNPVFTMMIGFFVERKELSILGATGVVFVAAGLYLLRLQFGTIKKISDMWFPVTQLFKEPGTRYMLGVALIWSVGAYTNKLGIVGSSPLFFSFSLTFIGSIVLFLIAQFRGAFSLLQIRRDIKQLSLLGVLNGLSELFLMMAIATGAVPYVISLKRSSILFSLVTGRFVCQEKIHFEKIVGVTILFIGVLLIILG